MSVKKANDIPADYRGKYTELELRDRGVGKIRPNQGDEWNMKRGTYTDEGVQKSYLVLNRSLILLCTDYKGHRYMEMAHRVAQIMIDRFLFQRCNGEKVPVPGPLVSEASAEKKAALPAKKGVLKATAMKADFKNWDGKIDTISDINWIYNHLMVADVTVEDAPSPGAWAHLQYHRSTAAAMAEFFTKVYPRLIPAKGTIQKLADKLHDDGRTTFDLLDRLLAECEGSSGQVPVLPVVLPERSRLQDTAGQPAVPEKMP